MALPAPRGNFDGVVLDALDPADEDERAVLIRAEHRDLVDAIEQGCDEVLVGGESVNPRLHLTMHEAVANQVSTMIRPRWGGPPSGCERPGTTATRSCTCWPRSSSESRAVESEGAPYDRDRYVAALDALPGSWEEDRPPAPDHDDDDDDGDEMDALLGAVLQVLRTRGPLTPDELAASLDADRAEIEMGVAILRRVEKPVISRVS